jgi:predicted MPP superfamily phosphohydrolase
VDRFVRDFGTGFDSLSLDGHLRPLPPRRRRVLRHRIEVTTHAPRLRGLPPSFRGLRIVQLTDIHHGWFLPLYALVEAVEIANRLEPDVVALTGDFVTYSSNFIEPVAAILGLLRARLGTYAVLGNHDFRVGAEKVARALRREGIEVLRNRHTILRLHGHGLPLAGVDDIGYGADLARALHGIRGPAPVILLAHNPRILRRAAMHGVSLVLSGHTHGGQVRLPGVSRMLGQRRGRLRLQAGWETLGATQLYVSRGLGTVVLPVRYRCPAEIPRFTLQAGEDTPPSHPR